MAVRSPDGNGICTPSETACAIDSDCTAIGDVHGSGMLGASCNNRKCEYDGALIVA